MDQCTGKERCNSGIKITLEVRKEVHGHGGTSHRSRIVKQKTAAEMVNVNVQKVVVTLTFLFVPLFLLVLFTYLPFFKMVQFSFYDMKYRCQKFVGLQNYVDVFHTR